MESAQVEEAACVSELRESRLNTYREMPNDVSSHYNDEGENEENYYGRFAYELIQNADDAVGKADDPENPCKARFELRTDPEPALIVANTGPPVDEDDTRALTTIGDTTKRDADRRATIGHKGRGFSAVLGITEQPYVFSTDVSFMFDRERSRQRIKDVIAETDEWDMADIAGIPLMRLPFAPDRRPERVADLLDAEHETVFYFPLREDVVGDVRGALTELDRQTVLFLHNLNRLEVETEANETTWKIGRHGSSLEAVDSEIDRVKIHEQGETKTTTGYLRFTRDAIPIGEHTAGISNNTWGDVTETRVSVAVRAERRDDGIHLLPVDGEPRAHVFLPTEERSPVPLLVNGAFDSNLSRTSIDITDRELDYNRFLIRTAANIVSSDIATVARGTATTATEFLSCVDFTTWADPESRDENTFRDELIRALQQEFADVECVPIETADDTDAESYVAPTQVLIPSVLDEVRDTVVDFVAHWGQKQVRIDDANPPVVGYFPAADLLEVQNERVPSILRTLGSREFPLEYLPRLITDLPSEWFTITEYPPGQQQTAIDPVVELVAAVWTHLDDDAQETFATAARREPLVPVGTPPDDGQVTRVRADDTELYIPPEDEELNVDIPGVRFVTEYVYRPRGRLGSQALPQAVQHRQSVIKQVWRPDTFQFEELVRTTVTPRLSETETESSGSGIELRLLALLRQLGAETADPDAPLPLRDRYDAQPLYRLCQLPVPTREAGWCPAHRVYFGREWLSDDDPGSIEPLFEAADIDAPMFIPPDELEARLSDDGVELEDGIDIDAWRSFLRWIGISPHLRLEPFFDPDEQRQFSETVAEGGVERPTDGGSVLGDLSQQDWEAYQDHLEVALDDMTAGRQKYDSIYRVNRFEYWDTISDEATATNSVGRELIDHLISWWVPVFSGHREAVLATHKVGGFGGRNSSAQKTDELREVGTNLWLWELKTSSWCPSTRGPVSPTTVWDLREQGSNPFTLGKSSLLPVLERTLDPAEYEAQPFLEELGIRRHLSAETFTPEDARTVCDGVVDACESGSVVIAESLRDIQPIYRQIQDLAPPIDEPLPEESPWHNATDTLGDCPVLCREGESFEFNEAQNAYFARSPSVRADYPFEDLPFFVLEEQRAARFGEYFGLCDFTAAVTVEGEPIDALEDRTNSVKQHLADCGAYILCRLEAERPSQRLIDQDLSRMQDFLERLQVVNKIEVTYTLDPIGDGEQRETDTTTEFYLRTRYDGSVEERYPFVAHRDHDREQWQLLARTLCAYLDVTQFEGIDALLSASTNEERRRYLQYANAPSSKEAIEQKQKQIDDDQENKEKTKFGEPERVNDRGGEGDTSSTDGEDSEEGGEDTPTTPDDDTTPDEQHRSPTTELYEESELRVEGNAIVVEPSPRSTTDPDAEPQTDTLDEPEPPSDEDALTETAPSDESRDQSQYDVEDLGMALAEAWEATRLAREHPDCPNPEEYVFRVDERHLVEDAREGKAKQALTVLETEAGIPEHYPGFDLLTVNPETMEPDRLIELKAATCRRRKPSVSWNEWTTARNEWVQNRDTPLYYLYIVGHLSKTTGSEPYIRTIANPFRLLDAQIEHEVSITQTIQVDIEAFSEENLAAVSVENPVLEVPVETEANDGRGK